MLMLNKQSGIQTLRNLCSEGKGLRKTVRTLCDVLVCIPMKGRINSLNVSVATGIFVFEIMRHRLHIE